MGVLFKNVHSEAFVYVDPWRICSAVIVSASLTLSFRIISIYRFNIIYLTSVLFVYSLTEHFIFGVDLVTSVWCRAEVSEVVSIRDISRTCFI